jgi:hypothetical protein
LSRVEALWVISNLLVIAGTRRLALSVTVVEMSQHSLHLRNLHVDSVELNRY